METSESTKSKLKWVEQYKNFIRKTGECPHSTAQLLEFAKADFESFKSAFDSLQELEIAFILWYFQSSNDLVEADENSKELSNRERYLAFLYVMSEKVSEDTIVLQQMLATHANKKQFLAKLTYVLNQQHFQVFASDGKMAEVFEKVKLNPKRTALTQHSLSVILFLLKDRSSEHQDTDAYIEKSTDLLFKLTDTSTLTSLFDFGKFMMSRKKEVFTWQ